MLMEGESDTVSLTVINASPVAADFVHVSIFDSTTAAMKEALAQKRITASEMYEIEYHMTQLPAVSPEASPTSIAPGACETFQLNLLGKPGLSSITFQIDYANIAAPHLSNDDGFFTRQITYTISVTVNASIQVPRIEILPLSNDLVWPLDPSQSEKLTPSTHCLALVDLRNVWPSPLSTTISVISLPSTDNDTTQASSTHTVQPGQTARHLLLLPRIHIPRPHAPIPTSRSRQFVRSTARHDPAAERAARETFWLRRALLARLRAEWSVAPPPGGEAAAGREDEAGPARARRGGRIDLGPAAAARLPRASAAALRLPDLELALRRRGARPWTSWSLLRCGCGTARRTGPRAGSSRACARGRRGGAASRRGTWRPPGRRRWCWARWGRGEEREGWRGSCRFASWRRGWRRCAGGWRRSVQ